MSEILSKAAQAKAAFTDGSADSSVLLFSAGTTHAEAALPESWYGCRAWAVARGTATKSIWYLCAEVTGCEVDRSIAAAADGAGSPKLGQRIVVGESLPIDIPNPRTSGGTIYLVLETDDVSTTLELQRSSNR